jgi:lipopolysaccharide exporter
LPKLINLRGDLFATAASFAAQAVIKLGSSVILTRILQPDAYGVITILMSLVFFVEMLSDIGVAVFVVRDARAEEPAYLNTAWTLKLGRASLNAGILLLCAGPIANLVYHAPQITAPLRVFSLWFFMAGLESMALSIAIRRKRARLVVYSELGATAVSTAFSVIYCLYSRTFWGMVYGVLLNRAILSSLSWVYYPELRPKLEYDRAAAREIFRVTRFTMPSGLLTLVLSQFDKVVFLRLFDLRLLGVYGLASNIASSVESLISSICHNVLYPRCAHNFNSNRKDFRQLYYTENTRLIVALLLLPAAVGGAANLLVRLLYDVRYAEAGVVLQALMLRAGFLALATPPEDLLIAAGHPRVILFGSLLRAIAVVAGSLLGAYFFGFIGFAYGTALSGLPPLLYYWRLQYREGLLIARYEYYRVTLLVGCALATFGLSSFMLAQWSLGRIRFHW